MIERVGPFEVLREVGRGGMGVVYLARDTRLDREVAIKALPEHLATDPVRLERFEREAKTLAGLSHPNVAGIYGLEEQDGARYLVLEYVDGETLADRLDRGPLAIDEAIECAVQIAAGVEAAHEAGVIHRDLKPANIKITPDGLAKVLDFGLARADESVSSSGGLDSPTMTTPQPQHSPTIEGAILGTAAYMSPEQARGRRVDKRTDIWSFGVVLYEMLIGTSPFIGETASDSIGAVLHKSFDLEQLPADTPLNARRALERCLVRDRSLRYRDIGDVRIELMAGGGDESDAPLAAPTTRRRPAAVFVPLLAVAAAAFAVAWLVLPRADGTADRRVAHVAIDLSEDDPLALWAFPKLTADGSRLILRGDDGEGFSIAVRDLDGPDVRSVETPSDAGNFSVSPDGSWALYAAGGVLYRQQINGGPAVLVCDTVETRGTAWGDDGLIVFARNNRGPLHRVTIDGDEPEPLYEIGPEGPTSDRYPAVLPGNRGVLFSRSLGDVSAWEQTSLWVADLDDGTQKQLVRNASHGRYVSPGFLVFQREDTLLTAGFDLNRLELTTSEVPLVSGVDQTFASGPPQFDVAVEGALVYLTSGGEDNEERRIERVALDGTSSRLSERTGAFSRVVPSDDGRLLAIETVDQGELDGIAIFEPGRNLMTPLRTEGQGGDGFPVWSADGRWLAFGSNRHGGVFNVYRRRVGSASDVERVQTSDLITFPEDWSSCGRRLLVSSGAGNGEVDIGEILFDENGQTSGEVQELIDWPRNQFQARFSPDDHWIMFMSEVSPGNHEVFVVDADDVSRSVQVSTNGGRSGVWDTKRDRLYYLGPESDDGVLYAVDYESREDGSFVPAAPEPLFAVEGAGDSQLWYTAADGEAFIRSRAIESDAVEEDRVVRLVLNLDQELARLLGEGLP